MYACLLRPCVIGLTLQPNRAANPHASCGNLLNGEIPNQTARDKRRLDEHGTALRPLIVRMLGLAAIFDPDTDFGQSAYRNTKGRRVSGLSIGYAIRNSTKTAAGYELTDLKLIEVHTVARGANNRASGRA